MILESLIMDLVEVDSNRCTLGFVVEDGEEKSSIEKVLQDMGWVYFNKLVNPNLYIKGNKRIMFINPTFLEDQRFCGIQFYGIVVTYKSLKVLDLLDLMFLRSMVRGYGQYTSTHVAVNIKGYWEVKGF